MIQARASVLVALFVSAACGGATPSSGDTTAATSETTSIGLPNERMLDDGMIVGGQPDDSAIAAASEAGRSTVISLRTPSEPGFDEERQAVEARSMTFVSIPIAGAAGLTEENARALDDAITDPATTVLHCGSGNRAGAMIALRAFYLRSMNRADALALGRRAGLVGLESAVVEHFDRACADAADDPRCE